jgi:hypothetical protein
MAARPQPSADNVSSQGEGLPLAPGSPIPPIDIRAVFTALDLYRSLGRLEKAVQVLEEAKARHEKDLNGLGKVAHTASMFGKIALVVIAPVAAAIIYAIVVHIYHAVERLLF